MSKSSQPSGQAVPTFVLYEEAGEQPEADAEFVHIETVGARARLHDWEIRPHRHAALHQFLALWQGQAGLDAEGRSEVVRGPALIAVPAGLVHGFSFTPDAEGFVLTVADRFLDRCEHQAFEPLPYPAQVVAAPLEGGPDLPALRAAFEFLHEELSWRRPHQARVAAVCLELILVAIARRTLSAAGAGRGLVAARSLLSRFKREVKAHAAEGWSVERYARILGVSVDQLNRACAGTAGRPPMRLVHDWLMAEAKRSLIYTGMSVQEVGLHLGFTDPAYFTRFFTQREGCSPSAFRRRMTLERTEGR